MPDQQRLSLPVKSGGNRRRCLLLAFCFFAAMVIAGSLPGKADAISSLVYDKLLHFTAYGSLAALIYFGLGGRRSSRALHSILAIAALGAADETIQLLLAYRHGTFEDWQFNMLGAAVCIALLSFWQPAEAEAGGAASDPDTQPQP